MADLKIGLIGCGSIARSVHIPILNRLPGARLVAMAEIDPQRREEARRLAPMAAVSSDYQELLGRPDLEAVIICLPTALHAEAATAALERGKHVYLEKPLATSLEEGRRLLAAWKRAGTVGMVGFNYRFNALYQSARRQLDAGRLGPLTGARSAFSFSARRMPAWKQKRLSGGGVLLDLASHHLDLIRFLFHQEVLEVSAELRSQRTEEDTAMLQMSLADGLLVQSFFSMCSVEEDRFEICGQAGKLTIDRYLSLDIEISDPTQRLARLKKLGRGLQVLTRGRHLLDKLRAPLHEPSYEAALAHFVAAARGNSPYGPDFWDGYVNLAVLAAAEESARTRRAVSLPDPTREGVVERGR